MRVRVKENLDTHVEYPISSFTGEYSIYIENHLDRKVIRFRNSYYGSNQGIFSEDFRRLVKKGIIKLIK
jgi:hypothetical protein